MIPLDRYTIIVDCKQKTLNKKIKKGGNAFLVDKDESRPLAGTRLPATPCVFSKICKSGTKEL